MTFYKLDYQHNKDIVDDNVLTVFVVAQNKGQVEDFAKTVGYAIENIEKLTQEQFEHEKEVNDHFRLEYAEEYL